MSTSIAPPTASGRPSGVATAAVLGLVTVIGSVPFFFLPGYEEVPRGVLVISVIAMVLTAIGVWGLWNLRRWGALLTFIVTLLNTVSAIPALVDPPSGWLMAGVLILTPISVAILVLIMLPSSRRVYR